VHAVVTQSVANGTSEHVKHAAYVHPQGQHTPIACFAIQPFSLSSVSQRCHWVLFWARPGGSSCLGCSDDRVAQPSPGAAHLRVSTRVYSKSLQGRYGGCIAVTRRLQQQGWPCPSCCYCCCGCGPAPTQLLCSTASTCSQSAAVPLLLS
jgi:hypothetical protein